MKHLVDAGLIEPGTVLSPRSGTWAQHTAVVRADGLMEVDGKTFDTPSGAGRYIKKAATNGWSFWWMPDGRRLLDVRAIYTGEDPSRSQPTFDWSVLHTVLEALPTGYWTTYGHLADTVGTAPQPLGSHVADCRQCVNAHRVLTRTGAVVSGFRWTDPDDNRDPVAVLQSEGAFVSGRPDPARELTSDALQTLIEG